MSGEQVTSGLDFDRMVDNFDVYDHDTAQHVFEVTRHARSRCPVTHSNAYGGYWLVTSYAEVRQALSDPTTFSSSQGVGFPHHQTLMMPPIDFDPPLQKEFRRLLNPHFSRAGIAKYAGAIRKIAVQTAEAFADRGSAGRGPADLHNDFAAPFTAEVLARVILHVDDEDLFQRARAVASQISRHDPSQEGNKRAQLEQISEEVLNQRAASGARPGDCIDALLYGQVSGRPLTRDERVGTLMILILGGLSTTNAALTGRRPCRAAAPRGSTRSGADDRAIHPARDATSQVICSWASRCTLIGYPYVTSADVKLRDQALHRKTGFFRSRVTSLRSRSR